MYIYVLKCSTGACSGTGSTVCLPDLICHRSRQWTAVSRELCLSVVLNFSGASLVHLPLLSHVKAYTYRYTYWGTMQFRYLAILNSVVIISLYHSTTKEYLYFLAIVLDVVRTASG